MPPIFNGSIYDWRRIPPPSATPLLTPAPRTIYIPRRSPTKALPTAPTDRTSALTLANQQLSPLLRLPPELRAHIFEQACTLDHAIELRLSAPPSHPSCEQNPQPFAIVRTSRQLRAETAHLPLALNALYCATFFDLRVGLGRMWPAQRTRIRVLLVRWASVEHVLWEAWHPQSGIGNAAGALGMVTGLERVVVAGAEWKGKVVKERVRREVEVWVGGLRDGVVVEFEKGGGKGKEKGKGGGDDGDKWRWGSGGGWDWAKLKTVGG